MWESENRRTFAPRIIQRVKRCEDFSKDISYFCFCHCYDTGIGYTYQRTGGRCRGISKSTARFVLPICTTINMNGCAAFILVTSLFVMQNGGEVIDLTTILLWIIISVISAVGNAGVPMGCFFLTLSLMSGIGAPVAILGIILPIYTIIDMVETAENVWSDSCVCAMTESKRVIRSV